MAPALNFNVSHDNGVGSLETLTLFATMDSFTKQLSRLREARATSPLQRKTWDLSSKGVICLNAAPGVMHMSGFSVDASETPDISARCLVSAKGRSVKKSQTWPRVLSFIGWLLGGLSFIGWLLRQAYLYWLAPPEDGP